ncbi:transcription elongation factor GreA [Maridesulfovibrio sp.]|uniref:transcription elongation factor GreA n=1 Tax=unclassified Maridesulfovibrio TaxID=2794999 RepID=UPI003B006159
MSSIPISKEGFAKIKEELASLKKERPEVIKAIAEAREEGDLKENGGYHAARERQGMLEAKINYIESRIPQFNVVDMQTLGGEKITFGATVELEDIETGDEKKYTIMGPDESDFKKGIISIESPVGQALLGKEEGDEVVVNAPKGKIEYGIVSVTFNGPISQ